MALLTPPSFLGRFKVASCHSAWCGFFLKVNSANCCFHKNLAKKGDNEKGMFVYVSRWSSRGVNLIKEYSLWQFYDTILRMNLLSRRPIFLVYLHYQPNNVPASETFNSGKIANFSKEAERQTDCLKAPF